MKNVVFWDTTTVCASCENRRSGGTYCFNLKGEKSMSPLCSQCKCTSRRTAKSASCNGIAAKTSDRTLSSMGRLIIDTFDEATAGQLYLYGNRHDDGDTVARGFLPRPSWGASSLQTKGTQSLFRLKMEAICSSETSVLTKPQGVVISKKTTFLEINVIFRIRVHAAAHGQITPSHFTHSSDSRSEDWGAHKIEFNMFSDKR
jgi:hypothetical protein